MVEKPFKKVTNALTTHFIIYVPSTKGNFKMRILDTQRFLDKTFGGSTQINAVGTYVSRVTGGVIKESVAKIECFTKPALWKKLRPRVEEFLRARKRLWKQEEIALEYEENMFWV